MNLRLMKMLARLFPIALSLSALTGCSPHNPEQIRRLAGEGNLPQVAMLPDESVELRIGGSGHSSGQNLVIEVSPDNLLSIRRYRILRDANGFRVEDRLIPQESRDRTKLPQEQAGRIRRYLAAFRPGRLGRDFPILLPKGCGFITDTGSLAVVAYHSTPDIGGLFLLQNCSKPNAGKLAKALRSIVAMLPETTSARDFKWDDPDVENPVRSFWKYRIIWPIERAWRSL